MPDPCEETIRWSDRIDLVPDPTSVARYFGGNRRYRPNVKVHREIEEYIQLARGMVTPRFAGSVFPVGIRHEDHSLILPENRVFPFPECAWSPHIRLLACAVGTLGDQLETECRKLAGEMSIYPSTLLDAVGTALLDSLSREIRSRIHRIAVTRGLQTGMRLAPGIDGVPMEHQRILFDLVDTASIRVGINDAMMMDPVKSISCFIPIGKEPFPSAPTHKCGQCRMDSCRYRL